MKTTILSLLLPVALMVIPPDNAFSQYVPTLEFTSKSTYPAGSGPSITAQVLGFQNNTNNPTGTTFVNYTTPTTTVTFAISNQQYTLPTTQSALGASLLFGAGNNANTLLVNGYTYYNLMNAYSFPATNTAATDDSYFTSASTVTAGTGIDVTKNFSLQLFTSVMGMYNPPSQPTLGRYYIANLTVTFNTYVTNPVIHIVGLGSSYGTLGFSTELDLQTPGLTMTKLSGSSELNVPASGTQILNSATNITGTTSQGGASGSVVVNGANITGFSFKVYVRGDGGGTAWSAGTGHSGDGWMIGISMPTAFVVLPLTITNFTASLQGADAQLQWEAPTPDNSSYFDVESSRDGVVWQDIGMVVAAGDGSATNTYRFTDVNAAAGNNYYRIKEVDAQGDAIYSPVTGVYVGGNVSATLSSARFFPNPLKDRLYIINNGATIQSVAVSNTAGKEVLLSNSPALGNGIDMSSLPAGIYFVTIRYASGQPQTVKVVKE